MAKSKSDEFFTFDEVLKELKLSEDELKKLVSEGEIRAFKDEDRMKFKKVDVESKRQEHITEPTVILPPGEEEIPAASNDATFIEEDTTSSIGAEDEVPIGSDTDVHLPGLVEEADVTTPIESVSEDIGATVPEEEIEVAETIAEEGAVETIPEELVETVAEKAAPAGRPKSRLSRFAPAQAGPPSGMAYPEMPLSVTMAAPKFKTPVVFIACLGAILLFLTIIGSFMADALRISSDRGKHPIGITREFGQMILDIVGIKDVNLDKFKKEE
ncbi:MAG: helix-turn-helix domain-containing protein [Planctomycetota bacterium]